MIINLNDSLIGKLITKVIDTESPEEQAEVLREIQDKFPGPLFKRIREKLLKSDIVRNRAIKEMGKKPINYK